MALSLLGACSVVVIATILYEHYAIHAPMIREMDKALGWVRNRNKTEKK